MYKLWTAGLALVLAGTLCVSCKTTSNPSSTPKVSPVAHAKKPAWLAQLDKKGVAHQFHRNHLELQLPVQKHFPNQAQVKPHLQTTLEPIAKQLEKNHYQLAEVIHYVNKKQLTEQEQLQCEQHMKDIMAVFKDLNIDTKVVVKSKPQHRRGITATSQPNEDYIAINLYQAHQGHGLVY